MSGVNINNIKQVNADTILKEEDVAVFTKIISDIKLLPDSFNFHEPVKFKEWGLVDYPQIIKNPMDLSTVLKKLKNSKYKYIIEVLDDIQLIWDNCKTYNTEGSDIFVQAENVEKHADNWIKKFFKTEKSENIFKN
jgi:hypothetical protein